MSKKIAIIASSIHPEKQKHLLDWYLDFKKEFPASQLFIGSRHPDIPYARPFKLNSKIQKLRMVLSDIVHLRVTPRRLRKIHPLFVYNPDVIHLLTSNAFKTIEPILNGNKKLIVSFRGFDINVYPYQSYENLKLLKRIFDKAEILHFISDALAKEGIKLGAKREKCIVIKRSIRKTSISEKVSREVHDKIKIISVGRLVWEKGYSYSLKAMRILKENGFDFEYIIVGDGIDKNLLYFETQRFNLVKEVIFLGEQKQKNVYKLLKESDIFLQTSVKEGLSRAIIEASYFSLPVVSSNIGGIPEVVDHCKTGFLSKICDPPGYAASLEKLIKNRDLRVKMGELGNFKMRNEFMRDDEIKKWKFLYRNF